MRLTLRTLLAYLEDALPPENAKRMGRLIARSAAARRLTARIRKVVRRRRLIAVRPDSDSRKGLDANDMSEYLDNSLPETQVHRVERRCLKHDALLAEAAACHQILSRVLGESPTINESARQRAYAAVGITAATPTNIAPVGSAPANDELKKHGDGDRGPAAELPIPTFAMPESNAGRAALASLVLLLFVALGVVLWRGLDPGAGVAVARNEEASAPEVKERAAPAAAKVEDVPLVVDFKKNEPLVVLKKPEPKKEAPIPETPTKPPGEEIKSKSPPPAPKPTMTKPAADVAPAVVKAADYISTTGVLCRLRPEGPERLQTGAVVNVGDVLVNLEGWRSELKLASGEVIDLVDGVKLAVRRGTKPVFEVRRGRMLVRSSATSTIHLGIGSDDIAVAFANANALLTVEHLPAASVAGTETPAVILLGAVSHDLSIEHKGRKLNLARGQLVDVAVGRGIGLPHPENTPVWLTGSQLSKTDAKAAERLAERDAIPFGTQGVATSLQSRTGDRNRDVRRMALRALVSLEAYPAVVEALRDERFADNRSAAFSALRPVAQTDPAGTEAIRLALLQTIPGEEADEVIKLLRGYSRQEVATGAVGAKLVGHLKSEYIVLRDLAIRNLKDATGKDYGYSAVEPAKNRDAAIKQWESHLRERR